MARARSSTWDQAALALALALATGAAFMVKKATIPMTLRELPTLADVPAPAQASTTTLTTAATFEEEQRLLHGAQVALHAGDTNQAFLLLYEHATRFPKGKLVRERQVTHMVTLCRAGKVSDARDEVTEFLAKDGFSPLAEQVKRICSPN